MLKKLPPKFRLSIAIFCGLCFANLILWTLTTDEKQVTPQEIQISKDEVKLLIHGQLHTTFVAGARLLLMHPHRSGAIGPVTLLEMIPQNESATYLVAISKLHYRQYGLMGQHEQWHLLPFESSLQSKSATTQEQIHEVRY